MNRLLVFLPWCITLSGFAVMSDVYPGLPERWPIHYNAAGMADGWASKTFSNVFFPLYMATGISLLFELTAQFGRLLGSKQQARGAHSRQANIDCLRIISAAIALFLAYIAYTLPHARQPGFLVAPVLGLLSVLILGPAWCFRAAYQDFVESTKDRPGGYRGLYFYDPNDPRLFVPKISGMGWTPNFAHPAAWFWTAMMVVLPLVIVIGAMLSAHP